MLQPEGLPDIMTFYLPGAVIPYKSQRQTIILNLKDTIAPIDLTHKTISLHTSCPEMAIVIIKTAMKSDFEVEIGTLRDTRHR